MEIPSSEILRVIGRLIGERAAERFKSPTLEGIVSKLDGMWSRLGIGRVELERGERPAITLRDCTICGQVPEIGRLYRCAFHEAFIEGLLTAGLGREVSITQEGIYEGQGGTWTRKFIVSEEQ